VFAHHQADVIEKREAPAPGVAVVHRQAVVVIYCTRRYGALSAFR